MVSLIQPSHPLISVLIFTMPKKSLPQLSAQALLSLLSTTAVLKLFSFLASACAAMFGKRLFSFSLTPNVPFYGSTLFLLSTTRSSTVGSRVAQSCACLTFSFVSFCSHILHLSGKLWQHEEQRWLDHAVDLVETVMATAPPRLPPTPSCAGLHQHRRRRDDLSTWRPPHQHGGNNFLLGFLNKWQWRLRSGKVDSVRWRPWMPSRSGHLTASLRLFSFVFLPVVGDTSKVGTMHASYLDCNARRRIRETCTMLVPLLNLTVVV
jgi:hypothetical protein